mmetsp:Transcript_157/g.165  ORF Transcript_157/g.165 Transcript_157/m.165 type:complete len:85 (-) Transcript_157:14-268(-)
MRLASPLASLEYRIMAGRKLMDITHTFTSPAGRGKGLAGLLAVAAFQYAKANGFSVKPTCAYISQTFLPKHPEFAPLVQNDSSL